MKKNGVLEYVKSGQVFHVSAGDSVTFCCFWPAEDSYRTFSVNKDGMKEGKKGSIKKEGMKECLYNFDWDAMEWLDGLDDYGLNYDL